MKILDRLKATVLNERGDNRKPGITWGQRIGNDECPYMRRWVFNFGLGSFRVHHWYSSDDDRALHDHPWWFVTLVLKGGYTDISAGPDFDAKYDGADQDGTHPARAMPGFVETDRLRGGSIRFRRACHAHTVSVNEGGCWTVMLTGRHSRDWGFYTARGWMRMRRYFRVFGHHPCE